MAKRPSILGLGALVLAVFSVSASAAGSVDALCPPAPPAPAIRQAGGLTVTSPPSALPQAPGLRLRTHAGGDPRFPHSTWIGPAVPSFVPLTIGSMTLDLMDPVPGGGYVALYRGSYASGVSMTYENRDAQVQVFDCGGRVIASVPMNAYLSRPDYLEVQDVRYVPDAGGASGTLYFNEACQTYSREAGGRCSSLVAFDPFAKRVLWRTPSLVSNNYFVVTGDYIVAAYGFTAEPAAIRIVRRKDGAIVHTQPLQSTNFEMFTNGDVLSVELYHTFGRSNFRMTGFDGATPKLVRLPSTPDPDFSKRPDTRPASSPTPPLPPSPRSPSRDPGY